MILLPLNSSLKKGRLHYSLHVLQVPNYEAHFLAPFPQLWERSVALFTRRVSSAQLRATLHRAHFPSQRLM
jgi:hypothetical protein